MREQRTARVALAAYESVRAIAERLAQSNPDNPGWKRHLATAWGQVATGHREAGDKATARARAEFLTARGIIVLPSARYVGWADLKKDLSWFDERIREVEAAKPDVGGKKL